MNHETESEFAQPTQRISGTDYAEMYRDAQQDADSVPVGEKPVLARRFELESPDAPKGMARERLHALRDSISFVQEKYPEVLGATIFGSTVQGRAKPESDIDGFLFVDADRAAEAGRPLDTEQQQFGRHIVASTSPYKAAVADGMRERGISDPAILKDLRELAISPGIITESIDKLIPQAQKAVAFRERVLALDASDTQIKAINDLNDLNSANSEANMPEMERLKAESDFIEALPPSVDRKLLYYPGPSVPRTIRGLFHLGVKNQQLRPYRTMVIKQLASHGQVGERIWDEMTKQIMHFEAGRRSGSIHFPSNLTEASAMYGVE